MNLAKRFLKHGLGIEGVDDPANAVIVRWGVALAVAAVAIRFFFWWYTRRVWEDALITVLHAENVVRGIGMTHYRTGQPPLHGFTSPLSVLVPLMGDLLRLGFGLQFIKIVGAFCGGLTVCYAMGLAMHPKTRLPAPMAVMMMGYLAFEHHQILWGVSGMETQIVTAILLMSFYYLVVWKPVPLGVSLGLCMLARPDFAMWTVIAGAYVIFKDWRALPRIVAVALAVYLPWIVFTTIYYGSPIPNTILAKSLGYSAWWRDPNLTFTDIKRNVWDRVTGTYLPNTVFQPLGPCFGGHGTGFRAVVHDKGAIANTMLAFALLGTLGAFVRRWWTLFPVAFFVFVYSIYYVFFVPYVFGWYVVPLVAATIILSAHGFAWVSALLHSPRLRTAALSAVAVLYLGCLLGLLPKTFAAEKQIQEKVENRVRKQIGLYLNTVMGQDESIGCEPLGYVGYYSQRTVYDWPGLANRKVVQYSREHPEGRTMNDMFEHFRPDYLVLRFYEYNYLKGHKGGWIEKDYEVVKHFQTDPNEIKGILLIAANQDKDYLVLRKIPDRRPSERNSENAAGQPSDMRTGVRSPSIHP